jgi:hypothetical protein
VERLPLAAQRQQIITLLPRQQRRCRQEDEESRDRNRVSMGHGRDAD